MVNIFGIVLDTRDCGRAMMTECLTKSEPYVHKSPLVYSLVGNVCLDSNPLNHISVPKTEINTHESDQMTSSVSGQHHDTHSLGTFDQYPDDEESGISAEDRKFISIMENGIKVIGNGSIQLPLPLK